MDVYDDIRQITNNLIEIVYVSEHHYSSRNEIQFNDTVAFNKLTMKSSTKIARIATIIQLFSCFTGGYSVSNLNIQNGKQAIRFNVNGSLKILNFSDL